MLQKCQSESSQSSVDSSQMLSLIQSFQSTQSLPEQEWKLTGLNDQLVNSSRRAGHNDLEDELPKEIVRVDGAIPQEGLFGSHQQLPDFGFVGFVGLGKANNNIIHISQSKLKRAHKFMSFDQSPTFNNSPSSQKQDQASDIDSISTQSVNDNTTIPKQVEPKQQQYPSFTLGFKSMGTGVQVKITQQYNNKVKLFFDQFSQSKKKQTKTKLIKIKDEEPLNKFANFAKTEKSKVLKQPKLGISQDNRLKLVKKPAKINQNNKKMIQKLQSNLYFNQPYKNIKLCDLPDITLSRRKQFHQFWRRFQFNQTKHNSESCQIVWCYFCQKYKNQIVSIDKQFIKKQVINALSLKQNTMSRLDKLLQILTLKLCRHEFFNPAVKNKRLNPNNLILQLYKKCLVFQKQLRGPLQMSLSGMVASRGKNLGKHINLMVLSIDFAENVQMYFLGLTDGWTVLFGVVNMDNLLWGALQRGRLLVGTKIEIVNWSLYPISNIGEYHPVPQIAKANQYFIQFNYNNSMPSPYFSKLGWPKQIFYRPFQNYKQGGGNLPIIQGIVIRMFTMRSHKNTTTNYIEVLLREGYCILMKVALAQQMSLVEFFRLYYSYHFMRVKKISNSLVQFIANSKYYEINDQDRMNKVQSLLKQRLLNTNKEIKHQLKPNNKKQYYDIMTKSEQIKIGDMKLCVDQKIDGVVLLQQYMISQEPDRIIVTKGDRGSCLRRIPKIYQKLQYNIF